MTVLVGLSGGLGSGKTTVCGYLRELGAFIVEADAIFEELQAPGGPVVSGVAAAFGPHALGPDGRLDIEALGGLVREQPGGGDRLGHLLHGPWVAEAMRRASAAREAGEPLVVLAVPMLFDSLQRGRPPGSIMRFDATVCVWIPRDTQIARTHARDGSTRADAELRVTRQLPGDVQRTLADHVIDNSGSLDATRAQVRLLHRALRGLHAPALPAEPDPPDPRRRLEPPQRG